MKLCLTWREFYGVLLEQNLRFGAECLVFLFLKHENMEYIRYDSFYLTYESLESRVRIRREQGFKVIPITKDIELDPEQWGPLSIFILDYLHGREIKSFAFFNGYEVMIKFEPNLDTMGDLDNHFMGVMLDMIRSSSL
jgi:hypothetical protein